MVMLSISKCKNVDNIINNNKQAIKIHLFSISLYLAFQILDIKNDLWIVVLEYRVSILPGIIEPFRKQCIVFRQCRFHFQNYFLPNQINRDVDLLTIIRKIQIFSVKNV